MGIEKIDIKDIKVKQREYGDGILMTFVYDGDGESYETYYSATEHSFVDYYEAENYILLLDDPDEFEHGLTDDIYVRYSECDDESDGEGEGPLCRKAANRHLENLGMKLGKWHYIGSYYELETI